MIGRSNGALTPADVGEMTLPEILLYLEDPDGKTPYGQPSIDNPLELAARIEQAKELRKQHPLTRLQRFQRL